DQLCRWGRDDVTIGLSDALRDLRGFVIILAFQMKWISRAILLLMLSVAGVLLAFGLRAHRKVPLGRVVVAYWEKWSGTEADAMKVIVQDFNDTVGAEKG